MLIYKDVNVYKQDHADTHTFEVEAFPVAVMQLYVVSPVSVRVQLAGQSWVDVLEYTQTRIGRIQQSAVKATESHTITHNRDNPSRRRYDKILGFSCAISQIRAYTCHTASGERGDWRRAHAQCNAKATP